MIQNIRPKVHYLKKSWSSIHNLLNIKRLIWKRVSITHKDLKQIKKIKRIGIEIEIQNKFYF
jgi:mannose/fructose/N-acetylgalactosamine-specific phosphotransferase system component IIB